MEPAVRALLVGLSEDNHREGLRQTPKHVAKAFHDGDRECDVSSVVVYAKFLLHRVVFFVLGLVLMVVAHTLSEFVVFYYGGAMTIDIFLVILIILFQPILPAPLGRPHKWMGR